MLDSGTWVPQGQISLSFLSFLIVIFSGCSASQTCLWVAWVLLNADSGSVKLGGTSESAVLTHLRGTGRVAYPSSIHGVSGAPEWAARIEEEKRQSFPIAKWILAQAGNSGDHLSLKYEICYQFVLLFGDTLFLSFFLTSHRKTNGNNSVDSPLIKLIFL